MEYIGPKYLQNTRDRLYYSMIPKFFSNVHKHGRSCTFRYINWMNSSRDHSCPTGVERELMKVFNKSFDIILKKDINEARKSFMNNVFYITNKHDLTSNFSDLLEEYEVKKHFSKEEEINLKNSIKNLDTALSGILEDEISYLIHLEILECPNAFISGFLRSGSLKYINYKQKNHVSSVNRYKVCEKFLSHIPKFIISNTDKEKFYEGILVDIHNFKSGWWIKQAAKKKANNLVNLEKKLFQETEKFKKK